MKKSGEEMRFSRVRVARTADDERFINPESRRILTDPGFPQQACCLELDEQWRRIRAERDWNLLRRGDDEINSDCRIRRSERNPFPALMRKTHFIVTGVRCHDRN